MIVEAPPANAPINGEVDQVPVIATDMTMPGVSEENILALLLEIGFGNLGVFRADDVRPGWILTTNALMLAGHYWGRYIGSSGSHQSISTSTTGFHVPCDSQ
jgi:hypothetical protein